MSAPPVPPRPPTTSAYDVHPQAKQDSARPPVPPLPLDFRPESEADYGSPPHFENPLAAPRPYKLQPDLPANMALTLHEQASSPPLVNALHPSSSQPYSTMPGFVVPKLDRAPSPLPPPRGSDWSPWNRGIISTPQPGPSYPDYPSPYGGQPFNQYTNQSYPPPRSIEASIAALTISPSPHPQVPNDQPTSHEYGSLPQPAMTSSQSHAHRMTHAKHPSGPKPPPGPPHARQPSGPVMASGPQPGGPALTAPLPTVSGLSASWPGIVKSGDAARQVTWCRDVLTLVDRAQHLQSPTSANAPNVDSTDVKTGPVRLGDPELQRLVDIAIPRLLELSESPPQPPNPLPLHMAEAVYLRAKCAASGAFPQFIPINPRTAFRDYEFAARSGYHAAWFKLGRDYENFGDTKHAIDCFERGVRYGVESCFYRMGMAYLMGQLSLRRDPAAALPLLQRAATLATVEVPQPAYVYGLLLLQEFSHISLPPELIMDVIPSGSIPEAEARKHLERAAYLNFAPAQYKLGYAYEYATPPFPFDALLSVQYYSLASQQGEVEADMALSKWFLCGAEGAFEKDENLALTFAEKAARKGLPNAEFAMGYYAEVGVGGPKDVESARRWYTRASEHGNTDATDRLKALTQPSPQVLSRVEHENLTDSQLVRRRTQAKQRSDAGNHVSRAPSIPVAQGKQMIENIRKNSLAPAAALGVGAGVGLGTGPAPSFGTPAALSPPLMGPLSHSPPIDDPRYSNGPTPNSTSPRLKPANAGPPAAQAPARPFANATRYSLADPGSPRPNTSNSPVSTPVPSHASPGKHQSRPSVGGYGSGAAPSHAANGPNAGYEVTQPPVSSPFSRPPPGKGPQTFEEMGIKSTKLEEKECIIM